MAPPPSSSIRSSRSQWLERKLLRYVLSLISLAVPAAVALALRTHPAFNPVISVVFIIAVCASAWWAGALAGVFVSFASIPVLTLALTGGRSVLPPKLDPIGIGVLCFIALLVDGVCRARKRAEQVLRSANEALETKVLERTAELERSKIELERSRRWLQIVLSSIGDAVIATDKRGSVSFMNGIAEQVTGWTQQEAFNHPLGEIFAIVNETTRLPIADPAAKVLSTGMICGLANHTILIRKDGREVPIDDSAAPIFDEQKQIAGVVLIFRDITERRRNERVAEEGRRALERTNYELQQFAYAASHDLQEPLRNVKIYAELLGQRYRGKLDAAADQILDILKNGAIRMEALIKDLLAYTTVSNVTEEGVVATNLEAVVQDVLANMGARIEETQALITRDHLPTILINSAHAQQLFQNLIGNAIKYRSDQQPQIHLSVVEQNGCWVFAVNDNGIGIDPAYKEHVFGLFKRLHSSNKYSGTGIGLAICQRIVERCQGRIWVESELGKGSTFFFTIPLARSAMKDLPARTATG